MPSGFTEKVLTVNDRPFMIRIISYENGNFISVTENSEKIGGMIVAINSGLVPSTSTVIPAKSEELFFKLVSEKIAQKKQGICIITGNFEKVLDNETTKQLMETILEELK